MGFLCGGSAGTKRFRRKDRPGTAPFGSEQPFGESKSSDFSDAPHFVFRRIKRIFTAVWMHGFMPFRIPYPMSNCM